MVELSVVIPVYNEQENIVPMMEALRKALSDVDHEVIFVDDGSSDSTIQRVLDLPDSQVRLVRFRRNFGQTPAMAAGIEAARGEYVATLDGDLQNDPSDIPMMLEKLKDEGWDIVAGRRANRQDGMIWRKIPSITANWLIRRITGTQVRDLGCSLKLFRSSLAKQLELHGELHRFIPVLGSLYGARITEVDVKHHARQFGRSKYGMGRILKVMSDLLLMFFFQKYRQKPMHLFGTLGISIGAVGALIELYLLGLKIMGHDIGGRPLFYVGIVCLITSVQLITTGFIAELITRTYYAAGDKRPYSIAEEYEGGVAQSEKVQEAPSPTEKEAA